MKLTDQPSSDVVVEAGEDQVHCWPTLGEACGECDRCKAASCVGPYPVEWPDTPRNPA